MIIDLTDFKATGASVSSLLSANVQFVEDITSILSEVSDIETTLMDSYIEGTDADRELIDKILETTQNWRESLDKMLETAPAKIIQSTFSLTEGISKSINQPYLTYDSSTNDLTIQLSSYSNDIYINAIPTMKWENGSDVFLTNEWHGIGTQRAICRISPSDHYNENIYGSMKFVRSNTIEPVKTITKFTLSMIDYTTNQPYASFNQLTNKLTINMNVFKDTPHINQIPVLNWIGDTTTDTETVELQTDWVGLGTYAINCIISIPDSLGAIAENIEGTLLLTYEPGSSEAWSLTYDWNTYEVLITTIQTALSQTLPQTGVDFITYAETVNSALADTIELESQLEKDYAIASKSDMPIIEHVILKIQTWKDILLDSMHSLNTQYPFIRTS